LTGIFREYISGKRGLLIYSEKGNNEMKKVFLLFTGLLLTLSFVLGCESKTNGMDVNSVSDDVISESEENSKDVITETQEVSKDAVSETQEVSKDAVSETEDESDAACELEDGIYLAEFNTDSTMFHVNEMNDNKGELIVKDGKMTIHISLPSKSILNLYYGMAEDAQKDGATLLEPTIDLIDYNDGTTEEVHGYDIPVPYLDKEFDVALVGKKGVWYDHKVSVSDPVLKENEEADAGSETSIALVEGTYQVEVFLEGGSGKAGITSPTQVKVTNKGTFVLIEWSSPNYDYMIVNGEKYLPVNTEGNSTFEIPVEDFDEPLDVIADTVAMSKPHEIEYTLTFKSDKIE